MKLNILTDTVKEETMNTVCGAASAILPMFLKDTLAHMIPWLVATFAVIICDLAFGLRKCMLMKESIRISSAARRTMGKTVTYFAFVCTVCSVEVAAGSHYGIDKWSCLAICLLEFSSIVSNILKPKGITLDLKALVSLAVGKFIKVDSKKIEDILINNEQCANKQCGNK